MAEGDSETSAETAIDVGVMPLAGGKDIEMRQCQNDGEKGAEDRRREYIWAKAKALAAAIFGGVAGMTIVVLVLRITFGPRPISDVDGERLALLLALIPPPLWIVIASEKRNLAIAYVPPVAEQVAALPAGEVLVRGSNRPAAGAPELLRSAQAGATAPEEDLLRPVG